MDAQDAVEPFSPQLTASPKRPVSDCDKNQFKSSGVAKSPRQTKADLPSIKDAKLNAASSCRPKDDDSGADGNSDAETIVLPDKNCHSPSKARKIKHEGKAGRDDGALLFSRTLPPAGKGDGAGERGARGDKRERNDKHVPGEASNLAQQKKKFGDKRRFKDTKENNNNTSSALSSAPSSPKARRRSPHPHSESESERLPARPPPQQTAKDMTKTFDKVVVPMKRKVPRAESEDDADSPKVRRQRASGSGLDASRKKPLAASKSQHEPATWATRSVSPHYPRPSRRSLSTQLPPPPANGLSHTKKKVPAALQSTDYQSDESSASASPHGKSSKLRSLTTPATAESTMSSAKMVPHKKHLDAHGQTFLARACAKGDCEVAKTRLQDRPEDINVADFAGNTPLQIAAINGCDDIVKLLVDAGCNLDCVNNDKDTPLLDAVENGHLEVVKILLDAGVNPRKANAYGQEPIDRIQEDDDNANDIRRLLVLAKKRENDHGHRRRSEAVEDHLYDDHDTHSSHGPESPRRSPAPSVGGGGSNSRRSGTARVNKTSNHLLYMPMDDKTLRAAAARGDEETVTRILQCRESFDDSESMVKAARGGHDFVMQLLLALGQANPDPPPLAKNSPNNEFGTPILAAIGQENLKVIQLLLDQTNFNPTRKFRGQTYFEIARERRGPNWMEEETLLKKAHDNYKRRRPESGAELEDDGTRHAKKKLASLAKESQKAGTKKVLASSVDKRRSGSVAASNRQDEGSPKNDSIRQKRNEKDIIPAIPVSDRQPSPAAGPRVPTRSKRAETELVGCASSDGETPKPRRKLVSGRDLRVERDKDRRASMVSTSLSLREPSSPRDSRPDEQERVHKPVQSHDRTKTLKKEDFRDRAAISGDGSSKRPRLTATPPRPDSEKDNGEVLVKRRRLDVEAKEKRSRLSPYDDRDDRDDWSRKGSANRDSSSTPVAHAAPKSKDDEARKASAKSKKTDSLCEVANHKSPKLILERAVYVKPEDADIVIADFDKLLEKTLEPRTTSDTLGGEDGKKALTEPEALSQQAKQEKEGWPREQKQEGSRDQEETEKKRKADEERKKREAESKVKEEEDGQRRVQEERERLRVDEEIKRRAAEKQRERKEEESRRKEEARKLHEEEESRLLEEQDKRRREEEEVRHRAEEERRRREAEDGQRREEEERKRREEEEQLRREREATEEARRRREEEERKERALREEVERRRLAREAAQAEQRRIRLEQERLRVAKLPPLLQWLDGATNPKRPEMAEKFSVMQGVRFDCIRHEANGRPDGREQWVLNTQVALLLGQKDLDLSQYMAWERMPVSTVAKRAIWRHESDRYALTTPKLYDLGRQLPGYYGGEDPDVMGYRVTERLRAEAWENFVRTPMFFVKASELMFVVPTIHHLRNVQLTMAYLEIPEDEGQLSRWAPLQKWKTDPDADRFYGFAPSNKYFVNGQLVGEDKPGLSSVSSNPFPDKTVPRRGLTTVLPDDPDYAQLCKQQGLGRLVNGTRSPPLLNSLPSSPTSESSTVQTHVNGLHSPSEYNSASGVNDHSLPLSPSSEGRNQWSN